MHKTWEDFKVICRNKKLILYGLGSLLNYLFIRCDEEIPIIAAIDNDVTKQGLKLGDFFDETDLKSSRNITIESKDYLRKFDPDEVVVLISTIRYAGNIAEDLEKMNFHCYFSVLHLENNYKRQMNLPFDNQNSYVLDYARKCLEKFSIDNNKIIFGGMDRYPDHGRYITEQLLAINKNFDIVWVMNTPSICVPEGIRVIYEGKWKQFVYELETAKFWIFNMPIRTQVIKREGQIYFQLKHWGSITLKSFYLHEEIGNYEKDVWKLNGKMIDYMVGGSDFDEETSRRGFDFHGPFLRFGSPRSDPLFEPKKYKDKIYQKFGLDSDEQVLIYAPTFRLNNVDNQFQEIDFDIVMDSLKQRWGGKWKILLRYHPSVKIIPKHEKQSDYLIDVSKYEGSQELVAASDVMISDYSSIMFEPAHVLKPVFLYAPDKDTYIKNERDFLLDYDSLPFPTSRTNEELAEQIKNFDYNEYKKILKNFLDKYGVHEDGNASKRTAEFIVKLMKG